LNHSTPVTFPANYVDPPPEPKVAYPEPPLGSSGSLALIHGSTFFAATEEGALVPPGSPNMGLFFQDTRFLSHYELRTNGQAPALLSSNSTDADLARVGLTVRGGAVAGTDLDLPINTIFIDREFLLGRDRLFDTLTFQNFHHTNVKLTVELLFSADFMDIFQVRGLLRGRNGRYARPMVEGTRVRFRYEGLDDRIRYTEIGFAPQPQLLEGTCGRWELDLPPHGQICLTVTVAMAVTSLHERGIPRMVEENPVAAQEEERHRSRTRHMEWRAQCTRLHSDNKIFDSLLQTSIEDFFALRIRETQGVAVAAGVPWFAALFGRDSLISSYQTLLLDPDLARDTLRVLASYQGRVSNDERDEDPGKILHERRSGEMTATHEVAFGRSYGSVDATPLFLIVLHEYFCWTADLVLLLELKDALKAATRWLLQYGDLDGDGLIEYCRRNPKGLFNQGWKDSGDANRHSDGRIAQPPIALVEVQGYAVRGLAGAAELLTMMGEPALATEAGKRSAELRGLLEQRFWLDDRRYYAMALDKDKSALRVDGSNPGHLLFCGAISAERARQVATKLLSKELFSGWGLRTLSSAEQYYNPMSYHCGSVWPHDTSMIGYGMARYGLRQEASVLFQALYDAALHYRKYRLPELLCGIGRQLSGEPVHYPVSCSPQAWASGAPFLLLTGLLGLQPRAQAGELVINQPHLPAFVQRLRIDDLRIGSTRLSLEFVRRGAETRWDVLDVQGQGLRVVDGALRVTS
jgi:glycogen debranching enzyme